MLCGQAQVPRYSGTGMPTGCRPQGKHVPKSVKSRAQCLIHRACLACHTGPQAPSPPCKCSGAFSCGQSAAWQTRSFPLSVPPTARPHNKVWEGTPTVRGTLVVCRSVSAGKKELQVCDSLPPNSQSQSPMRFSYYPPISLPLAPLLHLIPLHSLLHFIKKPFQKVNTLPE